MLDSLTCLNRSRCRSAFAWPRRPARSSAPSTRRWQSAGGSLPVWLVLLNLKVRRPGNQRELAEAVGITGATLTHHLNAMHAQGLIARTRDDANRRVQVVTLTEAGEAAFLRLREAAIDLRRQAPRRLRRDRPGRPRRRLDRLAANVGTEDPGPPWPPVPIPSATEPV